MKQATLRFAIVAAAAACLITSLPGCACGGPDPVPLLSAAGFQPVPSGTCEDDQLYASTPSYRVQPRWVYGKMHYAYQEEDGDVTYVGGTEQYGRYQQLLLGQPINYDSYVADRRSGAALSGRNGGWGPFWFSR